MRRRQKAGGGGSIKFRWKAAGRVPVPERINCRDTPAVHQWADPRNAHRVPAPARPPSAEAHERHLLARVQRRVLHALDGAVRVAGSVACMGLPLRYRLQAAEVEHLHLETTDPCRRRFLLPRARHSAPRCDALQTVAVMAAAQPRCSRGMGVLGLRLREQNAESRRVSTTGGNARTRARSARSGIQRTARSFNAHSALITQSSYPSSPKSRL